MGNPQTFNHPPGLPFINGVALEPVRELQPSGKILQGLQVKQVNDNSAAALSGLLQGDIILRANHTPVHTLADMIALVKKAKQHLLLKVKRGGSDLYLVVMHL